MRMSSPKQKTVTGLRVGLIFLGTALLVTGLHLGVNTPDSHAMQNFLALVKVRYKFVSGTVLDDCLLCHTDGIGGGELNTFGEDFFNMGNLATMEEIDSDGDGFTNLAELQALTFPGDPASFPGGVAPPAAPDSEAPPPLTPTEAPTSLIVALDTPAASDTAASAPAAISPTTDASPLPSNTPRATDTPTLIPTQTPTPTSPRPPTPTPAPNPFFSNVNDIELCWENDEVVISIIGLINPDRILVGLTAENLQRLATVVPVAGSLALLEPTPEAWPGDPENGQLLFESLVFGDHNLPGCAICHSLDPNEAELGPPRLGLASRSAETIQQPDYTGSATDVVGYFKESLFQPDLHVAGDYAPGQMYTQYEEKITATELNDLIAYMLTLE